MYLCGMYIRTLMFILCCTNWLCKGIPPELLEQYSNLNISKSFIKYDTSAKYPILLPYTQVKVVMPAPYSEKISDVYNRNNQKVVQQNYNCILEDFGLNFIVYYRPIQNTDLKNPKAFFAEEKERMIIQFGNYPVIEQISADRSYFEYYTQNGKINRVNLVIFGNTLIGMQVGGNVPAIYAAPANDFFSSLEIPLTNESNTESLLQPKHKNNTDKSVHSEIIKSVPDNSSFIIRDSLFAISFPLKPLRNDFYIKNEIESYQVINYYTDKINKQDQYLVSYRKYVKDIEHTDVFFNNAAKVFAQSAKSEIIEDRNLEFYKYPAKEVIFKTKKNKFTVRYFAKGDTFIQLVIKSKIKGDNKVEALKFFDSFIF